MVWFLSLAALAVVTLAVIWFFHRFYAKANRDTALVRTGLGGQKVVIDGGCLALPIVHQVQKVSMAALSVPLSRRGGEALLTGDFLRADVDVQFEMRVMPTTEGVAAAAQSLGRAITRGGEAVEALVSGQLVNAVQDAAASRTLAGIHGDRTGFTREVGDAVRQHVEQLGLTLISVALLRIDQGSLVAGDDDNNTFNAEGLRRLANLVAENRKERVFIETAAEIAVQESRLECAQKRLAVEREEKEAVIAQREHLARREAEAEAVSAVARAESSRKAETAGLEKDRNVAAARIGNDQDLRKREMEAILALEETKIEHAMQLAARRADEADVRATEEESRSRVVLASEAVQTDREAAVAEREKRLATIRAEKEAAVEEMRTHARTRNLIAEARAQASATETAALAEKTRLEAEADGRAAMIAADNSMSDAVIAKRIEEHRLDRLPEIMTQMMKPVEKIDSIRINQLSGAGASQAPSEGGRGVDSAFGAAMDQILSMAVRLPAMKQMGEDIGLDLDANLAGRTADYASRMLQRTKDTVQGAGDEETQSDLQGRKEP